LSETVWSIGAEWSGDVVFATAYAPLLQNMDNYRWTVCLPEVRISSVFQLTGNQSDSYPSLQTQSKPSINKLPCHRALSTYRYDATVPVQSDSGVGPAYWVAGVSKDGHYAFKTAIYNTTERVPFNIQFENLKKGARGNLTVITAPAAESSNVLGGEDVAAKTVKEVTAGDKGKFVFELGEYSVAVLTTSRGDMWPICGRRSRGEFESTLEPSPYPVRAHWAMNSFLHMGWMAHECSSPFARVKASANSSFGRGNHENMKILSHSAAQGFLNTP
jgi:hypothetical protein